MPPSAPARLYLDHAATTPVHPAVWEAMRPHLVGPPGNPASAHGAGRQTRRALEDARELVAARLGAAADEVIFTSGATEANNLALFGLAGDPPGHLLASPIEHPCVAEPLARLAARGFTVEYLPVSADGLVDLTALPAMLRPDTRLVTVMLVNHETGAIQEVVGWGGGVVGWWGGVVVEDRLFTTPPPHHPTPPPAFHTDAAQAVGKIPVHFHALGVSALTLSAHKFGGPPGVGALVLRRGTKLRPLLYGGHQQQGRRPGTEPVALAVGLAAALDLAVAEMDATAAHIAQARARFLDRLRSEAAPLAVNGPADAARAVPHILNVSFPGCAADALLMALDLAGVACSTGSACSSGSLLPSPVLQAMGVPGDRLRSAMRFSFGASLTEADVDEAAARVAAAVRRLRAPSTEG